MGCSFISGIQDAAGNVADIAIPVAAIIPGPWQIPAQIAQVAIAVDKGGIDAAIPAILSIAVSNVIPSGSITGSIAADTAIKSAGVAAATGGDPVKAAITGAIAGGVSDYAGNDVYADPFSDPLMAPEYGSLQITPSYIDPSYSDPFSDPLMAPGPSAPIDVYADPFSDPVITPSDPVMAPSAPVDVYADPFSDPIMAPSDPIDVYADPFSDPIMAPDVVPSTPIDPYADPFSDPAMNPDTVDWPSTSFLDPLKDAASKLTATQYQNILKSFAGLLTSAAIPALASSSSTAAQPDTPYVPLQQMPTYSPEYFQQVQQNYNTLLPTVPKDVVSPLQDWYNPSQTRLFSPETVPVMPQKSIVDRLFGEIP